MDEAGQNKALTDYRRIILLAEAESPCTSVKNGTRGRAGKTPAGNLIEILRDFGPEVLRFMTGEDVPFANNMAERNLRMAKVQQKVSGCFRSKEGAEIFCLIRSCLISCNKSNANPMDAFQSVFGGNLPSFAEAEDNDVDIAA